MKAIILSPSDHLRLVTKYALRAQAAEMVLDASKHILTGNPEPTSKLLSDKPKMLVLRAKGYKKIILPKSCFISKLLLF